MKKQKNGNNYNIKYLIFYINKKLLICKIMKK